MTSMAESARPWRLFWAVPLPEDLGRDLSSFVAQLQAEPGTDEAWRFTDDGARHLTLAFLGATDRNLIEPMTARVRGALRDVPPFEVRGGGLGGFPRNGRSRVLWYGIADPSGRLAGLADAVRAACELELDDPFRPHVTLARSRDRRGAGVPNVVLSPPTTRLSVSSVVLFRSHLGAGPARYEELARLELGAPSMAGATA